MPHLAEIPNKRKDVWGRACPGLLCVCCFPALRVFGSRVGRALLCLLSFVCNCKAALRIWRGVPRAFGRARAARNLLFPLHFAWPRRFLMPTGPWHWSSRLALGCVALALLPALLPAQAWTHVPPFEPARSPG